MPGVIVVVGPVIDAAGWRATHEQSTVLQPKATAASSTINAKGASSLTSASSHPPDKR
jgi:hypothetical protein